MRVVNGKAREIRICFSHNCFNPFFIISIESNESNFRSSCSRFVCRVTEVEACKPKYYF